MTDRERDALVAERVMGWRWMVLPDSFEFVPRPHQRFLMAPNDSTRVTGGRNYVPAKGDEPIMEGLASIPWYSTEITSAWQIVEHFAAKPQVAVVVNNCHRDEGIEWCVLIADEEQVYEGQGPLPLAICRAALAAVGVEVEA